ncbi:hypothetical protein GJ496_007842 [Pomphorhynchus laevis]|nr:hypothetical protein GJ496_007842 [Pomphorhynchus laevis]
MKVAFNRKVFPRRKIGPILQLYIEIEFQNTEYFYSSPPTRIDPPILNEQLEQASSMDNDEFSSDDCEEDDDNRTSTFKASSILLENDAPMDQ